VILSIAKCVDLYRLTKDKTRREDEGEEKYEILM